MKIALLGYGKEGQATENYFKSHFSDLECDIFDNFTYDEIKKNDFSSYDMVFRSPSVPPLKLPNETSMTKYFFDHCPCPIIGVTGTKGKGTVCSMINVILSELGEDTRLIGNIGIPAIGVLDGLKQTSVVIFELSSFQLWDLKKSPQIAAVLRIEPDHLNVHEDFDDYVNAKSHIAKYQTSDDAIIYFKNNINSVKVAQKSPAEHRFSYPYKLTRDVSNLLSFLTVPGNHNKENASCALLTAAAYLKTSLDDLVKNHFLAIKSAFRNFRGLPHHLELIRSLNGVDYYDDSFSASYPSLDVAIKAFPNQKIILIAGGKNRNLDLQPIKRAIFDAPNLKKAILIGETRFDLARNEHADLYILEDSLKNAVIKARTIAENECKSEQKPIVLLSPGAASFDMFKDFYERGEKFQQYVKELK